MNLRELFVKIGVDLDEQTVSAAESAIKALRGGLEVVAGAAAAAGAAIVGAVALTVHKGSELNDMSERFGVNVEQLQEFGYAAELSGASLGDMAQAMRFMARQGVKDLGGELQRVADHIASLPDDGSRAAYAIEHLGRNGAALVPMLKDGSANLAHMAGEARALGIVLDKEDVRAADKLGDTFTALKSAGTALAYMVGHELMPVVQDIASSVKEWWIANKDLIRQKIQWWVKRIGEAAKFCAEHWRFLAVLAAGAVTGAFVALLPILQLVITYYLGMAAAGLAAAGSMLAAAWPVIALTAVFAALYLMLEDLYYFLTGGKSVIGEFVDSWSKINDSDPTWLKALKLMLKPLSDALDLVRGIANGLDDIAAKAGKIAAGDFGTLGDALKRAGSFAAAPATMAVGSAVGVSPALTGLVGTGLEGVGAIFGGGASPQASVAGAPSTGRAGAPAVTSNVSVQINGLDETAAKRAVQNGVRDGLAEGARQAHEALQ